MTFDDDFMQLEFDGETHRAPMKANGFEWPGPELLRVQGFILRRVSHSQLTDEQREAMPMIMRGARYVVDVPAACMWPDCGHDTNQVDPNPGCAGEFCPKRLTTPTSEGGNRG